MAEDTVVKEVLTEQMVEGGASLLRKLDELDWPVVAAFWIFDSEDIQWKLMIVSPRVTSHGPKEVYEAISHALNDLSKYFLSLQSITVTTPEHPLVRALATAIGTGPGISGIRFSRNTINGRFIEDAYLYRVNL